MTWTLETSSGDGVWGNAEKSADYDKLRSIAYLKGRRTMAELPPPAIVMVRIIDSENYIVFFEWRRER